MSSNPVCVSGAEAGIAFDAARDAAETAPESHTELLDMLEIAIQDGIRPDAIARLVTIGVEVAEKLGVEFN